MATAARASTKARDRDDREASSCTSPQGGHVDRGRSRGDHTPHRRVGHRSSAGSCGVVASGAVRPPVDTITAPPFPAKLPWVNVASLRMDQQRGRPGARRVLGLLPRQLAAHAPVPQGVARALRRGRAARRRPCTPPASSRRATRTRCAPRSSGSGIEHPVLIDTRAAAVDRVRQRGLARAVPVGAGRARPRPARVPLRRGRATARPSCAIQELLGVEREPLAPLRPEDDPRGAASSCRRPTSPGAWSGPYEAGGVWAVLSGDGDGRARTAADRRRRTPARTR